MQYFPNGEPAQQDNNEINTDDFAALLIIVIFEEKWQSYSAEWDFCGSMDFPWESLTWLQGRFFVAKPWDHIIPSFIHFTFLTFGVTQSWYFKNGIHRPTVAPSNCPKIQSVKCRDMQRNSGNVFFLFHVSNDKNSNHFFSPDQENIPLPEIGKSFREMGFRFRSDWAFRAFANISFRGKIVPRWKWAHCCYDC